MRKENEIQDKFSNIKFPYDESKMFTQIQEKLKKRKRRRLFLWLIGGSGILLLIMGFFFVCNNFSNDKNVSHNAVKDTTGNFHVEIMNDSIKSREESDNLLIKKKSSFIGQMELEEKTPNENIKLETNNIDFDQSISNELNINQRVDGLPQVSELTLENRKGVVDQLILLENIERNHNLIGGENDGNNARINLNNQNLNNKEVENNLWKERSIGSLNLNILDSFEMFKLHNPQLFLLFERNVMKPNFKIVLPIKNDQLLRKRIPITLGLKLLAGIPKTNIEYPLKQGLNEIILSDDFINDERLVGFDLAVTIPFQNFFQTKIGYNFIVHNYNFNYLNIDPMELPVKYENRNTHKYSNFYLSVMKELNWKDWSLIPELGFSQNVSTTLEGVFVNESMNVLDINEIIVLKKYTNNFFAGLHFSRHLNRVQSIQLGINHQFGQTINKNQPFSWSFSTTFLSLGYRYRFSD